MNVQLKNSFEINFLLKNIFRGLATKLAAKANQAQQNIPTYEFLVS